MKKKGKKLFCILISVTLVLGMMLGMAMTAYAEGDITPYPLRVGGVQVTSANLTIDSQDNEAISGSAVYDDSTKTLTLKNFSYTGPGYDEYRVQGGAIDYRGSGSDLTIVLEGTNSITKSGDSGDNGIKFSYGIYFNGGSSWDDFDTLIIDGPGSLTIGFDDSREGLKSNGIFCEPGAFVMNGGTVVSNAGTGMESLGIYADRGITFNGGSFTGNGYYSTASQSCGIFADGCTITVNGGTVTGTALLDNAYDAYGFNNWSGLTLNGGNLTAIGKQAFSNSYSWGVKGGDGTQLRIFAGSDEDSAALVNSIPEDANYVQIQVLYNVTITPGSNMTKTTDSGAQSQTALVGAKMTDVVYTADDGYYFPENYSVKAVNGISVTRNSFKQITISGTPTASAAIKLTAPTAKTTPDAPATVAAVNCTSADSNDGKLTGVTTAMEYKKSDADSWTDGTGNDITGLLPGTYYVRLKATDTTNASGNRELTISTHSHEWATAWSSDDTYHWHACMGEGASDDCLKEEGAAKAEHTYGETGDARFTCTVCNYVNTIIQTASDVADLPAAEEITISDKAAIEAAKAAYEALSDEEKANVSQETLEKLNAAVAALEVEEEKEAINNLPAADQVTTENKKAIEDARAAYNALSDEQKAKISKETLDKLAAAEAAFAVAETAEEIENLPAAGEVTMANAEAIKAARAAYNALSDEQKAKVSQESLDKLEAAEVVIVGETVKALPEAAEVTTEGKAAIEEARAAYDALTPEQKEELGPEALEKLEAAETALAGAEIEALPAANEVTTENKEAVAAAREAYDKLTPAQKERVGADALAKLEAAEVTLVGMEISALPEAAEVTKENKAAIEAARAAYDALSDEQKAKVSAEAVAKLEAAEVVIVGETVKALPEAAEVTTEGKAAIEEARAAYDALTPEQKEELGPEALEKLEAAETALAGAEIEALPAENEVTTENKEAIAEARQTYEALNDEQKEKVGAEVLEKLEAAETALSGAEIEALPAENEVTTEDKEAIAEARQTYEALNDAQKEKVGAETLAKLEAAEVKLVEAEVTVLPATAEITIESKEAIEEARAAYEALNDEQKEKVGAETLAKLEAAEAVLAKIEVKLDGFCKDPEDGVWKYYEDGVFTEKTGLVKRTDNNKWYYVSNGIYTKKTGIAARLDNGKMYYVENGSYKKATGLAKRLDNGKWYYVENGVFSKKTGVVSRISDSKQFYVKAGVYDNTFTGLAKGIGTETQYFIQKGKLNNVTGLYNADGTWRYFVGGVFTEATGLAQRPDNKKWYYVENGVFSKKTGVAGRISDGVLFYVKAGSYDKSFSGLAQGIGTETKYFMNKGQLNNVTGLYNTDGTWRYFEGGVFTEANGIVQRPDNGKYYYVDKGVYKKSTGLAQRLDNKKWYYVEKGVFSKKTGAAKQLTNGKWYYVQDGKYTKATGLAKLMNKDSWYYFKDGRLDSSYDGKATKIGEDGTEYDVVKGKMVQ